MQIKVTCKADATLPFEQIQDFQGALKSRSEEDIDHLISSIERHGFSFPFFVWRQPDGTCSCLDGHGRCMALAKMREQGYEIPELPVVYIDAKDEAEARTKLIQINVTSGRFTQFGFTELVKDIPDLDFTDYHYPDLDLEKIDLELKTLAQAQEMIQSVGDPFDGMFGEIDFDEPADDAVSIPSSTPSTSSSAEPIPTVQSDAGPSVVGTASTVGGNVPPTQAETVDTTKPVELEMVVYCPECGESFIYKYTKEVSHD